MTMTPAPAPPDRPIRLIAVDIDGTLCGRDNEIQPAVLTALAAARSQGIPILVATGRMYRSALRFHAAVGSTLPLIAYQGALIRDPATGHTHQDLTLDRPLVLELLERMEAGDRRDRLSLHLYAGDRLHLRELTPASAAYVHRTRIPPEIVGDFHTLLAQQPDLMATKLLALCPDGDLAQTLLTELEQIYPRDRLYLTNSVDIFVEMAHPQVNKGNALRYVAEELLHIPLSQVLAIGDNFNDWELIQNAGIGVAMGNAPAEVQAIADWVAPSVDEDGVAAAIETFVLPAIATAS